MKYSIPTTLAIAMSAGLLAAASASAQSTLSYAATLNGFSESPANASPGTGFATVDITTGGPGHDTLHINVSFSGLTGTTTASHIHAATALPGTATAGVATTTPTFAGFPLGVTSGTYDNTLDLTLLSSYNSAFVTANGGTTAGAEAALLAAIAADKAYLNIHTSTFGGGEIRGFLVPVPEPGTFALMGLGAGIFALAKRRKA